MPACRWFPTPVTAWSAPPSKPACPVHPIPGPSAALAALSASGLPTDSFRFGGFLPVKPGQRVKALEAIRDEHATAIFYEAPHRILEALEAIEETLGHGPSWSRAN